MAVFKCKMCGGALEISGNETVATCDYCGVKQTVPTLNNDRKVNLYDRANHFRRNNEFDKAMGIYEQILNEDDTDAEAYWSLVLCRYGIEYVEDPVSHKRVPTVNRAQYTSVFDDVNYKSALQHADPVRRVLYEEEAAAINEIQKGILAISQKEEPFDVFICYKETDQNGRRTPDSVLANDLYHQLVQEGFKVFFARITLEDKLGTAYEPYIFAALNSAKVMVVLGTNADYFNAVWVKNEWSRYLALIKNGAKKILIPAYKDMDPYDLPEEFSHLQAQDMSKLGFMQDLIRGIKKLVDTPAPQSRTVSETVVTSDATLGNVTALLKRGYISLEDGEWQKADEFFEQALNQNAELAQAYLGKLMAQLHVNFQEDLMNQPEPFDNSAHYQRAYRFGDQTMKAMLEEAIAHIRERNEKERQKGIYSKAVMLMGSRKIEDVEKAIDMFRSVPHYEDATALVEACFEKIQKTRKEAAYDAAMLKMSFESFAKLEEAVKLFESLGDWRDSAKKASECKQKIEQIQIAAARKKKKAKRMKIAAAIAAAAVSVVTCVAVVATIVFNVWILPEIKTAQLQSALKTAKVGDCVVFGEYEQDNDIENGKEDIEWLVLDVQKDKMLVISKYALDCQPYNLKYENSTWGTCYVRRWLNESFVNTAFSKVEERVIAPQKIQDDSAIGTSTEDRVFLLSNGEASQYFSSDDMRKCDPTSYAIRRGTYKATRGGCFWWLRTPGTRNSTAMTVDSAGNIHMIGDYVHYKDTAIRPAMWIDLK